MNNNQRDARWANILLGFGDVTIGNDGCVISCIGNAVGATPDVVNTLLKSVEGFIGALVDWSKIVQAFPGITATVYSTYDNNTVLAELAKGNRVLVFVSAAPIGGTGMHCIEFIGNGQCKDPWTGTIRPTSDFPDVLGEWVSISGTWQNATQSSTSPVLNTTGLNTHGLDPTNEASNQVVFDTFYNVQNGLYVPVATYNNLKTTYEDLQTQVNKLNSEHVIDTKEIATLNSSLESLSGSNKNYANQALEAEKVAQTYTGYMDDIATELNLSDNNQTDSQLHDEIIKEIVTLHAGQQAQESQIPSEKILTNWEEHFKNIIDWLVNNGLNKYLTDNGLRIVDLEGNAQDNAIGDRVIAYLDDRFHRLDVLEQAQQALNTVKTHVEKSKNLFTQLLGLFYTKS